jgi:ABC-type glycerol-3-phosphate transport system substrate-binding protein
MEYPGFDSFTKRLTMLAAAGTPADITWYGAGEALEAALQGQLADVDDIVTELKSPPNLRLVVNGHNRTVPTSQQFVYGWYRSDLYEKAGLAPYTDWESYLSVVRALNKPPQMFGNIVPSMALGASHNLLITMLRKNDGHWFRFDPVKNEYEVALDQGENLARAVETLEFLHEAHAFSPEASTYNWTEIMSAYAAGTVANDFYIGARLLEQVEANNPAIASVTKPIALPRRKTEGYYVSVQGFHIGAQANVDAAKSYVRFFLKHPAYIDWLHSVPLHIIPAQRETLRSEAYLKNAFIRKRMDVVEFLDSVWDKGAPPYYWDGPELNPFYGLFHNQSLGGWMLAERNIRKRDSRAIVQEAAENIRKKKADLARRKG